MVVLGSGQHTIISPFQDTLNKTIQSMQIIIGGISGEIPLLCPLFCQLETCRQHEQDRYIIQPVRTQRIIQYPFPAIISHVTLQKVSRMHIRKESISAIPLLLKKLR